MQFGYVIIVLFDFIQLMSSESISNRIRNNHVYQRLQRTDVTHSCKTYPYVNRRQRHLCRRFPDVMKVALESLDMAIDECRYQLRHERWNCASLKGRADNPLTSSVYQKGYKESAFVHAILSSAIVHHVARACAMGQLTSCGCDRRQKANTHNYHISGCNHNVQFAAKFARKFLDGRQKARDLLSFLHSHNSKMGRVLVRRQVETVCKCHGLSGSCEFKTCWRAVPRFRVIGNILKRRYDEAVSVQVMNDANGLLTTNIGKKRRTKPNDMKMVYSETSPNFCQPVPELNYSGVSGRQCSRNETEPGSCFNLCCGKGYNTEEVTITKRCKCVFKWCCEVVCQKCAKVEILHRCK